jgi:hypothetical protein
MEWEERIGRVIDHYRRLYGKYKARIPRRPDQRVPEDRAVAERYVRWCDERDADELLFMEERFRHLDRTQRAAPMFRALRREKVMECWKKGGEQRALEERTSQNIMAQMLPVFDQSILDLSRVTPDQERYRHRHFIKSTQRVCMVMPEYSGGYHPESRYCPQCSVGPECAGRLNGQWGCNVIALRSGRLDLVPAKVAKVAAQG